MKKWVLNNKLIFIGSLIGAAGGYMYYHFVGCSTGTCAITSSPINSTLYFAILGGVIMNILKPESKNQKETKTKS